MLDKKTGEYMDVGQLLPKNKAEFFQKIIDYSYDEIFVANGDGICIYCNNTFEKNYGVKRSDILGQHISYIIDNNYVDILLFDDVLKNKKEITYKQKTAKGRIILNTSVPVLNSDGDVLYVVENCRDITEYEILHNTLDQTQKQLSKEKIISNRKDSIKNTFSYFKSKNMQETLVKTLRFASKDVNLIITGKSGTGKTSLAKFIHDNSDRKNKPFININCTTIPENLIESELFGYKKGAFTGALSSGKKGLVEQAEGGTLFLDEVSEIPMATQAKLLELVQEKQFLPIGSDKKFIADIRIITATNKNLEDAVKNKKFREDLYYRLNVVQLNMPALKDRSEDISVLISHFLLYYNNKYDSKVKMPAQIYDILNNYDWPGNIRELEHLIEFLVINCQNGVISINELPVNILNNENESIMEEHQININIPEKADYKIILEETEGKIIRKYYSTYPSSYKLAEALNLSQSTANRLINKYCK
ncbi:sigma-54 interaction domain-containing protein [Peptostreptococcus equinus]|uniref:HTH-type transcriptional regulatory protein TyrR n=1 Tax=Peptostreptococcus equinus TaxID=3003601 RepID=A0ABY7JNW6_9FIRM|nr:sigma 54-interacting transcriptional regulator [Peptostreptococcus sp. CBA3647]WAW14854.1 sigma 54-interacting transcriptional regulator [Peptostreptococcus sp. CBA3647]